jgi:hypothetical protein
LSPQRQQNTDISPKGESQIYFLLGSQPWGGAWSDQGSYSYPLQCEKSLFVLASRQKIPVLRTENPVVDTRTICLPPIEFFLNSPCQKSYSRKIPAKNYRYSRKIPTFWSLEGDFLHSHAWKVKAGKSQQATTDTDGKSRGK